MEDIQNSLVTAEWARKTAKTELGAIVKKQLDSTLNRIKEEVRMNKMHANCFFQLEDLTKQELVKRGFKIKYEEGDPRDQREVGYYIVSW
jgi:hypothetical protein